MTEWMKSFVGYLLIGSIATQMLPGQKYEKYIGLFFGFLMIILLLQPILKIGSADSYLEQKLSAFVQEQEYLEEQILIQSDAFAQESEKLQEQTGEEIEIQEIETVRVEVILND